MVPVECKNYKDDPNNLEVDQLLGRFDPRRGYFGMPICRKITDRTLLTQRYKDAARSNRGYVIPLDDDDLARMSVLVLQGHRFGLTSVRNLRCCKI
jgi:hypothetical protein